MKLKGLNSAAQEAQAVLDAFGFVVIGFTHVEDAEEADSIGFLTGETWHQHYGMERLPGKVIGKATREDWCRQCKFFGDAPSPMYYKAFRKVIAE